jgi:hypothetical protein
MPEVSDEPDTANSQLAASQGTRRRDSSGIAAAYRNGGGGRIRRGMSEQKARREAILRFGNTGIVHESVADEDMFLSLNSICSDVLYAFRQLRRTRRSPSRLF